MKVYLLLDRSGSMTTLWDEALGSINGYVAKLKPTTKVVLAAFDSVSYDVIRDTKVSAWEDVTKTEVWPRGSTPLNDSVVRLVNRCLEDNPKKAVLVVMTDGEENCSREIRTRKQVQDVIKLATNMSRYSLVPISMALTPRHNLMASPRLALSLFAPKI
jgi:uncharacterized protein with von Willebrand factor type A (vWA) domain